jgi:prolyl 4-hydroxylase
MTSTSAIPEVWRQWLIHNRDRGCARQEIVDRAAAKGFPLAAINAVLDTPSQQRAEQVLSDGLKPPAWSQWFNAPITDPQHQPRAIRVATPHAQLYELPSLLSPQECQELIEAINSALLPSTVTRGGNDYRTSRTCHLRHNHPVLSCRLDQRFAELLGVDQRFSEPIQGQRYDPGEYFKQHTDWFSPGTQEFDQNTRNGGQRTWTVMVYLNVVESGGETWFKHLDQRFTPHPGLGLAWNNLLEDGSPNRTTLHEAMPVDVGTKWVITKWFREKTGRNG